ncbi:MAG: hypothetical protein CMH22_05150 [Methylophaga sp.]|nr:hypothetical protein [Methylophaga sp.]MAX51344.1 hypothetical protein [Methylophaga sp.]|tara:strand:+ start:22803 stop:23120 length:318 start_codon:yes stop_codon:yes gene_type:complete
MQKFDDTHSYLAVYAPNGEIVEYIVNTQEINKAYQETFRDIQEAILQMHDPEDHPFEMVLSDSQTGNLAVRLAGTMIGDLELVEMDYAAILHKHPSLFEPEDFED